MKARLVERLAPRSKARACLMSPIPLSQSHDLTYIDGRRLFLRLMLLSDRLFLSIENLLLL